MRSCERKSRIMSRAGVIIGTNGASLLGVNTLNAPAWHFMRSSASISSGSPSRCTTPGANRLITASADRNVWVSIFSSIIPVSRYRAPQARWLADCPRAPRSHPTDRRLWRRGELYRRCCRIATHCTPPPEMPFR